MQGPQVPRENWLALALNKFEGKSGQSFCPSSSAYTDPMPGWPMVSLLAQLDPCDLTQLPEAWQMGTLTDPGQVAGGSYSRCWQGFP